MGGLAMAVGMTTASHKYGLLQVPATVVAGSGLSVYRVQETVVEYEVVMGDGKLVKARKDNEHADLWHALPWSHGSLGLLVALTLEICPTKPWVALSYQAVEGHKQICQRIREVTATACLCLFAEVAGTAYVVSKEADVCSCVCM